MHCWFGPNPLDEKLTDEERDRALTELIELVGDVDRILQAQSRLDADYLRCDAHCRPRSGCYPPPSRLTSVSGQMFLPEPTYRTQEI